MKFLTLAVVFTSLVSGFAAPQINLEANSEFVSEDDVARKLIADELLKIQKIADDNGIAKAILTSIDQECMLAKYKQHKLTNDMLTMEAINWADLGSSDLKIDPVLVFANIAITCSNKLEALLEFAFDNLFSYSGLLHAFRNDEPFKEFLDDLVCYNNYAVQKKVLDPSVYPTLNYKLVNGTEQQKACEKTVKDIKNDLVANIEFFSQFVVSDHHKCLQTEISEAAEKFALQYLLLVPLGLSDVQKIEQKANFVQDARDGLEKLLVCNVSKNDESNEIS